jgi:hypothetical protein
VWVINRNHRAGQFELRGSGAEEAAEVNLLLNVFVYTKVGPCRRQAGLGLFDLQILRQNQTI